MSRINTMFRNPINAVYETLEETILRGILDEPRDPLEEIDPFPDDPTWYLVEDD